MEADPIPISSLSLAILRFGGSSNEVTLLVVSSALMLFMLFCSAMVSAAENSFFSLSDSEIQTYRKSSAPTDKAASFFLEYPQVLLATILVTNYFMNIGVIMFFTLIMRVLFDFSNYPLTGFLLQAGCISFIIILAGEIMPKIYAPDHAVSIVKITARPLLFLRRAFHPLIWLFVQSSAIMDKRLTRKGQEVSLEELNQAIDIASNHQSTPEEKEILKRVVNFSNIVVKQIMKARVDVVSVSSDASTAELMKLVNEWGYSRLPVYTGSIDNITGVLYIKDLLPFINQNNFDWKTLIKPAFFAHETKKINELLDEFQEKHIHMAVVVDEYGGKSGIVTMEDVLEEIFGEINDEFDEEDVNYSQLDDYTYVFEGKVLLNDLLRITDQPSDTFDEISGESDTLAGLVLEIAGKIPNRGQKLSWNGYGFIVEAVDKRRVKRVKFILAKDEEETK